MTLRILGVSVHVAKASLQQSRATDISATVEGGGRRCDMSVKQSVRLFRFAETAAGCWSQQTQKTEETQGSKDFAELQCSSRRMDYAAMGYAGGGLINLDVLLRPPLDQERSHA